MVQTGESISGLHFKNKVAGVAQLVEQRIRNAQVVGSSPFTSSKNPYTIVCGFLLITYVYGFLESNK